MQKHADDLYLRAHSAPKYEMPNSHNYIILKARSFFIALTVLLYTGHPRTSNGQQKTVQLKENRSLSIRSGVAPVSLVRSDPDGLLIGPPTIVRVQGDNSLVMVSESFEALRLSTTGTLARLLPKGAGPFEQRAVRMVLVSEDTTKLFDVALSRITTIVGGTPRHTSMWTPKSVSAVARTRSGYIVNGIFRSPAQAGFPLHLVDSTGAVKRSFGAELNSAKPLEGRLFQRQFAKSRKGCTWSVQSFTMDLDCLDDNGGSVLMLRGTPAWLRNAVPNESDAKQQKPNPGVVTVVELADGKLLLAAHVAVPNWRQERLKNGVPQTMGDLAALIQTVVVTVDPTSGSVSPPLILPGYAVGSSPDGRVFVYYVGADDEPTIMQYRIVSPGSTPAARP